VTGAPPARAKDLAAGQVLVVAGEQGRTAAVNDPVLCTQPKIRERIQAKQRATDRTRDLEPTAAGLAGWCTGRRRRTLCRLAP
jgi:hypothetical protein